MLLLAYILRCRLASVILYMGQYTSYSIGWWSYRFNLELYLYELRIQTVDDDAWCICQNYLAEPTVAKQYTQQVKWHCKRSVRQDGETTVLREKEGVESFFSSQNSRLLLVGKYCILTILSLFKPIQSRMFWALHLSYILG